MRDRERSAAAGGRRDAVAWENLHILGDHLGVVEIGLDPGNARDETVDFVLAKAGVFEGEFRGFDVRTTFTEVLMPGRSLMICSELDRQFGS